MDSDSDLCERVLDQRASVTLTADTAMGMIVTVEEAHCLLGAWSRQLASVVLRGCLQRPSAFSCLSC